jgi:hypothetical protein
MIVIIYTININYFPTLSPHTQKKTLLCPCMPIIWKCLWCGLFVIQDDIQQHTTNLINFVTSIYEVFIGTN